MERGEYEGIHQETVFLSLFRRVLRARLRTALLLALNEPLMLAVAR